MAKDGEYKTKNAYTAAHHVSVVGMKLIHPSVKSVDKNHFSWGALRLPCLPNFFLAS